MAPFTTNPTDSLAKFLLPVPKTLCSAGHKILVSMRGMLLPGNSTAIKWRLPLSHLRLYTCFWINRKRRLLLYSLGQCSNRSWLPKGNWAATKKMEVRKNMARIQKIPQEITLVLSCPVINANGTLQQSNSRRISNGPEPSEINI